VLAAGTAAALVPIKSITCESRNDVISYIKEDSDEPGEACVKLLTTLKGVQLGKIEDQWGWLDRVQAPKAAASNGLNGSKDSVDSMR
jgi:branched-chain amino acid aminotransferase